MPWPLWWEAGEGEEAKGWRVGEKGGREKGVCGFPLCKKEKTEK